MLATAASLRRTRRAPSPLSSWAGGSARPTASPSSARARLAGRRRGAEAGTASACSTRRLPRRRARPRLRAGGGGWTRPMAQAGPRRAVQPRRDEIEIEAGRLRDLPGHPRRPRARNARRDPAGAAYTEKSGLYVNTEGRVQLANRGRLRAGARRARTGPILRALSEHLGQRLPFDRRRNSASRLFADHPTLPGSTRSQPSDVAGAVQALAGLSGTPGRSRSRAPIMDFLPSPTRARGRPRHG
jgi:hypothetical protein